jgi:hypothetical protein
MSKERKSLVAFCAVLVFCSPGAALKLGVSIGRDGATLAAMPFKSQPLVAMGCCDLRSGESFVLRLKAGYGVLQSRQSTDNYIFDTYDYTGLDALRVQAAPCAKADMPSLPIYIQAGLGCGLHMNWTYQNSTEIDEGYASSTRVRGLDATALLTLGIRVSPRLSLELGTERLLADWSLTTRQNYTWDYGSHQYLKGSYSSGTALNWSNVAEPGYAVGLVWELPGTR